MIYLDIKRYFYKKTFIVIDFCQEISNLSFVVFNENAILQIINDYLLLLNLL